MFWRQYLQKPGWLQEFPFWGIFVKKNVATLIAIALTTSGLAAPTCLIVAPIADVLAHREVLFYHGIAGFDRRVDKRVQHWQGLTVGIFDGAEFGYDNDYMGTTVFNAKVRLAQGKGGKWAVSAGVQNLDGRTGAMDKYVVGRADFKTFRVHAGYLRADRPRLISGLDGPISARLRLPEGSTWMVDYVSGPLSPIWAAVNIPLGNPRVQLMIAGGIPLQAATGWQYQFALNYGFRF